MNKKIILIDQNPDHRNRLSARLKDLGCRVVTLESDARAFQFFESADPCVVIIAMGEPEYQYIEFVCVLKAKTPESLLMTVVEPGRQAELMKVHKKDVEDFITEPVQKDVLEKALGRAFEKLDLKRKLRKLQQQAQNHVSDVADTKDLVRTEKLISVRQVVDKLSSFVAYIARDAQGGMRYFKEMPYFVSIHDAKCKVIATNSIYKKHFGNKIGKNSWEIYAGETSGKKGCPVGKTINTGNVQENHGVVRYLSGRKVPVIVHTAPIFDNEGEVELILEVFTGTKELQDFENELRHTHQRYEKLFDEVPCHVTVIDHKFRVTAINRKFKEEFGDFTGKNFFDVFKQAQTPYFTCPITRTLQDGEPHHSEMVLTTPNGDTQNYLAWTSPVKTAAGKLIQVTVIFLDVTQLRTLQDNLSTLGLMIGSISHGIKGILTGIDAGLYLIDSGFYKNKPARIEEGLDVTKLMAERMRKLVYDILYYTKERKLEFEKVNVLKFAGEVAANMDIKIRGADIEFECDFEPFLGDFEIDVSLMRSAMINILENAMEACIEDPEDKAHKIIFRVARDMEHIRFDIVDNGPGMSKEGVKKIFKLFYSSKGSRGTGLGLFVTEKIINKHGGTISVQSDPGQGAHFQIRIPKVFSPAIHWARSIENKNRTVLV
jgi:PAS domain S-box-containing protein